MNLENKLYAFECIHIQCQNFTDLDTNSEIPIFLLHSLQNYVLKYRDLKIKIMLFYIRNYYYFLNQKTKSEQFILIMCNNL